MVMTKIAAIPIVPAVMIKMALLPFVAPVISVALMTPPTVIVGQHAGGEQQSSANHSARCEGFTVDFKLFMNLLLNLRNGLVLSLVPL